MSVLALAFAYTGLSALALVMERHHRRIWKRSPRMAIRTALRAIGALLLGISLAVCIGQYGWSIGPVLWFGVLTAAALGLIVLLSFAPRLAAIGAFLTVPIETAAAIAMKTSGHLW